MDSPFALALVRMSWGLDRFPRVLGPVRTLGYMRLGGRLGRRPAAAGRKRRPAAPGGLTLVVKARKRDA